MPAIPSWTPQWPHGLTKNGSSCPCCQPGVMDRRSWSRRQQDQALLDAQYEQLRDLYPQRSPPLNRIQSPPHQQETFHFEGGQDNEHEHTEEGAEGKHLSIEGRGDGDGDSSDDSSDKDECDDERGRDKEEQDHQSAQDGDDEQEDEGDEEDEDEDEDEEEDDEEDDDEDDEDDDDEEDEDEEDEDEDDEDDEDGGDGKDDTDGDDIVKKEPEEFHIGNNSAPAAFTQQLPPQLPSYRHEEDNVVVKLEPEDTDADSDMFLLDGDDEFVKSNSHQPSGLPLTAALHGLDANHIPMAYGQMPPAAAAEAALQQQQQQWLNPWSRPRPRRRSRANTSAPQPRPTVVSSGLAARNAHQRNAHLRTQPPPLQPHTPHATRATRPPRLPQLRVDAVVQADPRDPSTAQTPAGMDAFWDAALQRLRYEKQQQQQQEQQKQREQREQQLQLQQQLQEQQQQLLQLHLQEQQEQKLMQLQQMQQLQLLQQQQLPLPLPTPTPQKLPQPFAPLQPGWQLPWAPGIQSFDMTLPQRYPDPLPLQSAMPRVIISPPAYLVAFADGTVVEASRYQHEVRTHGIETARDRLHRFRSREPALSSCRGPPASRCNFSSYAYARRGRTCVDIISADPDSDGPRPSGAPHKRPCPCCNMYIRRKRTAMPAVDYWREKTRGDCIPISVLYDMLPRPPNPFADDY